MDSKCKKDTISLKEYYNTKKYVLDISAVID